MLCKMTRDRFERFLKHSFEGQSVQIYYHTWGVEVYINGLFVGYTELENRIGIDIRDIEVIDTNLSNLDIWKDYLKKEKTYGY